MTAKRLEIFIIVTIIAVIGVVYALTQKPVMAPSQNQNPGIAVGEPNPATPIEYKGEDGKNALELLKASHRVEAKEYEMGSFVTSIDGIPSSTTRFWAFYINGEFSVMAADKYITKSGDSLSWKLEEIKQ